MEKKVLHLSVSKQWFDMIASGEKKEEYREIKEYWIKRLVLIKMDEDPFDIEGMNKSMRINSKLGKELEKYIKLLRYCLDNGHYKFAPYTHVLFVNGYGNDKPRIEKEIECITIGKPKKGLCPNDFLNKNYFTIKFK